MNTINKAEDLKVGSVVRMSFSTYASEMKPDWTVFRTFKIGESDFMDYIADCKVCNVTSKFFQVIIPHHNTPSVRISKRCFTDTKSSYANMNGHKAVIVSI